ncbi:acyltransferase family protein [Hymenobacter fodinae]|uniref:Acyltransferase n=1 Tax=Hymenobacter fodinae TaxID=2510796 RepID=A0A4Z0P8T0_9BACT|nr:acyltransferase [Hymenobacter fodinae]TGE08348.1 acyltransferase [Hymenobacter fodinae]
MTNRTQLKPSFNIQLEALRGVAALLVVWHHVIFHRFQLDPNYMPTGAAAFNAPGHFAVMVFFLLSGYVIGASQREPLRVNQVGMYLKKRFTRIYPIYLLALLAGLAVAGFSYSWEVVAAHLIFANNDVLTPTIFENNPLWSLQHEVLFYLLFIPLSILRARAWLVAIVSILLSILCLSVDPTGTGALVSRYCVGFAIWSTGWALATVHFSTNPPQYTKLISALLLFVCIEPFNLFLTIGEKLTQFFTQHPLGLNVARWPIAIVRPLDLLTVPYAAFIVMQFIHVRPNRAMKLILLMLQLLPLYTFKYIVQHPNEPQIAALVIPAVCYVVSTLLFLLPSSLVVEKASQWLIHNMIPFGAISYGIYVIHFPFISLFHQINWFSGTAASFVFRSVLLLVLTLAASYLLEKRFQPWIKRRLF